MADDGPSAAEDATAAVATGLGDGDSRVTRERHKRADATTQIVTSGQDASASFVERVGGHEDASSSASPCELDDHHRSHQSHHERRLHHRHQYQHQHHHPHPRHSYHHHSSSHHCNHHHFNPHRHHLANHCDNDRVSGDSSSPVDATGPTTSDGEEENGGGDGIGLGAVGGVDSDCDGDSAGSAGSSNNSIKSSKSGAGGVAAEIMTGGNNNNNNNNNNAGTRVGVEDADGTSSSLSTRRSAPSADSAPEVNDREDRDAGRRTVIIAVATREEETTRTTEESASVSASAKTDNAGVAVARHQGSPFKGQVRMAEDTLVGPCGKKRCADRYDSSESSDSGVAVSCGECSSSGTSDITEPGSPCSTSSDEGVAAIRGTSASPLPSLPKLAPSSQLGTRPQWPWTPPLAATACSTTAFKRLRGEPEAGALPRSGAADPTSRGAVKANGKTAGGQHHHESQGKITEYFKTQIKPQQPKIKKTNEMVLVAKSSEFRRPPMVQRNKGGLAKYLGTVSSNTNRSTVTNEPWEVRTLTSSSTKKVPLVIVPRANSKIDKKLPKPLPSLPISNDVLKNLPKISSLRLTSDVSINSTKGSSPPATAAPSLLGEPLDFKTILTKPHVNENNNLTNSCGSILGALRSQSGHESPISRLSSPSKEDNKDEDGQSAPIDVDEDDVDEEDSLSSESKPSPILSAPTTIRFPARAPEKDRSQATDSGICRWDKCEANFESVGGLLEHLQAAHINTQTGSDNFVCQWQGCKVQGRTSCSRRWLERHVLSHGGNKPFRCIVDGCGCRFSSQTALERHVNGHFNQPETSNTNGRRSCENGGKLVRRNGKKLRYRRQPWSARLFDYFDSGVMEGLQHRLLELATSRTQGRLAETPGNSMALTSQVLARRVEMDGKTKVLLRWYPQDIEPDEWVLESEVQSTKHVGIRKAAASNPEQVSLALYPAISGRTPPTVRAKQRRKPVKNS
ncbi:JING protein, partial [Acromyrmex insinuator]